MRADASTMRGTRIDVHTPLEAQRARRRAMSRPTPIYVGYGRPPQGRSTTRALTLVIVAACYMWIHLLGLA